ncbi:MAG: hypothetical protein ACRELU_08220 [Gemmatimonadota bacterium]
MDFESTIAERELTDVETNKSVKISVERPEQVADDEWRDQLSWLGGPSGELGLSRRVPDFLGLEFERKLNKLIDREVAALTRALKEKADSA